MTNIAMILKMAIEIVSFPVNNGEIPLLLCERIPEGGGYVKDRLRSIRGCFI